MPSIHIRVFFYLILSLSNYIEMCISKEGVDLKANHYIPSNYKLKYSYK